MSNATKKSRKRQRNDASTSDKANDNKTKFSNTSTNNTSTTTTTRPNKKLKKHHNQQTPQTIQHAVLTQYYAKIQTLRDWFLTKLPKSSKIRRRKLASIGLDASAAGKESCWSEEEAALGSLLDTTLVAIRHHGSDASNTEGTEKEDPDRRWEQFVHFSQKGDESYVTLADVHRGPVDLQSEAVDYVIWLLFHRDVKPGTWPKHMLCDGFRKCPGSRPQREGLETTANHIPNIAQVYPNHCVKALKKAPWPQLLTLLGKAGQRVMLDLLLDCAIFTAVRGGKGNFTQLSGIQISEMETLAAVAAGGGRGDPLPKGENQKKIESRPSEIQFVRSRMLYARAALNARGLVHFGLRHIHVLNRYPRSSQAKSKDINQAGEETKGNQIDDSVIHIMMYMFPRQFGLHNVFTSVVDRRQTAQTFQDYTLREEEIAKKFPKTPDGKSTIHVPKRLRGKLPQLIQKLQVLHSRCSYAVMLQHYCPVGLSKESQNNDPLPSQAANTSEEDEDTEDIQPTQNKSLMLPSSTKHHGKPTKKRKEARQPPPPAPVTLHYDSLIDLATPISNISAFCQAVLSKIIPNEFWGAPATPIQAHNKSHFLRKVHQFISLRRFESMNLHDLIQGMKISSIPWLTPPNCCQPPSQSDTTKRTQLLLEFLYYTFDSLLIPLLRSNFYITESSTHRYALFFFRHDIWRTIAEPAMVTLKADMFEEVRLDDALRILEGRKLGFSQVRLLPKKGGVRPIMNLRRRVVNVGRGKSGAGRRVLGPSINSVLGPVGDVLRLERDADRGRLGASIFSVGEVWGRLKGFRTQLLETNNGHMPKLYFAKVDVQAAFDTIPQEAMVKLLSTIPRHEMYKILKHVELQVLESTTTTAGNTSTQAQAKTYKRWHTTAHLARDTTPFSTTVEKATAAKSKRDTVFVGSALERYHKTRDLLALARSHIQQNLVKVGKKYWRQKRGIPQGSVLSSVLCSWFYGDLERRELGFLRGEGGDKDNDKGEDDGVLIRLIDDFLLVTTDRGKAERFVRRMYKGFGEYGVRVRLEKSLVSFGMGIGRERVPVVAGGGSGGKKLFPYCGLLIDCDTLEVGKERDLMGLVGGRGQAVFNSLTVEFSRCPGQNFKRKVLNSFKIQSHLMFFDTSHNSARSVLANAYTAFVETATKMWAYARCLPRANKPTLSLVKDTLQSLVDVAYLLLTSRSRKLRYPGYECTVRKSQVAWLVMWAFREVLGRKQAGYGAVIEWLGEEFKRLDGSGVEKGEGDGVVLRRVVREAGFGGKMRRRGFV